VLKSFSRFRIIFPLLQVALLEALQGVQKLAAVI
jgi:hypothetical protein